MKKNVRNILSSVLVVALLAVVLIVPVAASETLAIPTATVTDIPKAELDESVPLSFALKFKADEVAEEQLAYYSSWYADFELTVNKTATFNALDDAADGYLAGQYDEWRDDWVSVPFEDVELKADETLKIMEYASSLMGQSGLKLTYNDVYTAVKEFDCGVYFAPAFLEKNPDLVVTLELRMYNPADETESYVIGDTYTFKAMDLFVASVTGFATDSSEPVTKYYVTLADAIAAAEAGDTVTLLQNVNLDSGLTVAVGQKITLDLNGFTLSGVSSTASSSALITNNGDLTINDSSEAKTGKLTTQAENPDTDWGDEGFPTYANNTITNCGTLTINGGRIENTTGEGFCVPIDNNSGNRDAVLIVNGGEIVHTDGNVAVRQFANSATHKNSVTVNDGLLEGKRAVWIQLPGSDTTKAMKAELTVNGGTLRSTDKGENGYNLAVYSYTYGNSFANTKLTIEDGIFDGDVALAGGTNKTVLETVSVTGGTFLGDYGIYSYGETPETGFVTGGNFVASPEDGDYDSYLAGGYSVSKVGDYYLVHEHDLALVDSKSATCTEDGIEEHYKCTVCGTLFADEEATKETTLENVTIPAGHFYTSHVYAEDATCTEQGYLECWACNDCNVIELVTENGRVESTQDKAIIPAKGHTMTKVETKTPTCTGEGNVEYYSCSECKKNFADEKGEKELTTVIEAAKGHKLTKVEAKAATCTEAGVIAHYNCSVCKKNFSDEKGEKELTSVVEAAKGHKLTKVEAKAATYTEAGNIEHYACACGKLFADAEGKKEITDVVIPQLIKVEEEKAEVSKDAVDNAIADAKEKAEETGKPVEVIIEVPKAPVVEEPDDDETSDTPEVKPQEVVKVELPVEALENVAKEEATLTVVMPNVTVTVDTDALKSVTEQAAGNTVTLVVEQVKEETLTKEQQEVVKKYDVAVTIKAEFICQETNEKIWTEDNNAEKESGSVTVKMPFTPAEGAEGSDYTVLYIADDGSVKEIETAFVDGHLVFALEHFSEYVVVNTKTVSETPDTGDNAMLAPFAMLLALSFAGVAVLVSGKKKLI